MRIVVYGLRTARKVVCPSFIAFFDLAYELVVVNGLLPFLLLCTDPRFPDLLLVELGVARERLFRLHDQTIDRIRLSGLLRF